MKEYREVLVADARGGFVLLWIVVTHAHDCRAWRMGASNGPCTCGGNDLWEREEVQAPIRQLKARSLP